MIKQEKAITLIALIITIIILVILAAVSIRAVYNMGIVNHAVNGAEGYGKAAKEEEQTMQDTESFLSSTIAKIKNAENGEDESIYENMQWEMAWVCNNGTWSDVTQGQNESELTGQIFAKAYKMENDTYHLIIDPINGGGEMGHLLGTTVNKNIVGSTSIENIKKSIVLGPVAHFTPYAWQKDIDIEKITKVIIHEGVQSIGDGAFDNCTSLTNITISSSITSIGNGAFDNCTSLTNITIPNSVTSIGDSAFRFCKGLTKIIIPSSVTSIGGYAFQGCTGLTNVTIPNSVTSIGECAFSECTGLTSITIPNSVTTINSYTFKNCTGLTSITIPNSVTSIVSLAFDNCTNLTTVIINSADVVSGLESSISYGSVVEHANIVYILSDLPTIGSYITSNFTKQATSDKAGYDKYVRN